MFKATNNLFNLFIGYFILNILQHLNLTKNTCLKFNYSLQMFEQTINISKTIYYYYYFLFANNKIYN